MIQSFQTHERIKRMTFLCLLLIWLGSCRHDPITSPNTDPYDLEAELVWTDAVNMDLWIIEPDGKGSGHGDPGNTAINNGNNDCGFGETCVPDNCSDLPCHTPERIVVLRGTALPNTTEPCFDYEIGISNGSSVTTIMTLTVRTQSQFQIFHCTVDGPRVSYVVNVTFPGGIIVPEESFVNAFCF